MQIACKTHANHMQIARETTSFNKSDDKSKKLEEQSKSGDAREIEQSDATMAKIPEFARAKKS